MVVVVVLQGALLSFCFQLVGTAGDSDGNDLGVAGGGASVLLRSDALEVVANLGLVHLLRLCRLNSRKGGR